MATATRLMTVAEFSELPEDGPLYRELHNGEPIVMPPPRKLHYALQRRLRDLLSPYVPPGDVLEIEVGFRPVSEYEFRTADVAWLSAERWEATNPRGWISGAPELVIEVLSPSNTKAEMRIRERLCLENGSLEFWIVDPDRQQITVSRNDGSIDRYRQGDQIPLNIFAAGSIEVDQIFTGIV